MGSLSHVSATLRLYSYATPVFRALWLGPWGRKQDQVGLQCSEPCFWQLFVSAHTFVISPPAIFLPVLPAQHCGNAGDGGDRSAIDDDQVRDCFFVHKFLILPLDALADFPLFLTEDGGTR